MTTNKGALALPLPVHRRKLLPRLSGLTEKLGVDAAWLTTGGVTRPDGMTIFGAAAVKTSRILLGTSIVPTWPRHPIAVAQQVQVLHQLSGGRFRLGVGPSHRDGMIHGFGVNFRAPISHLREYLRILKALLQEGEVDFEGRFYVARGEIDSPIEVPVMASGPAPSLLRAMRRGGRRRD